jgi:3-methyladenine DNA glycosylase AlkD
VLRRIARETGRDHNLALELWESGILDARQLACMVDDPGQVTREQMEPWASDLDSWAITDGACYGLFGETPFAYSKAFEWSDRPEEFVKRGAFALIAGLAVHDKGAPDECFEEFLPVIEGQADDDRNFVKKAFNWALRGIGKRNINLNRSAIDTAARIKTRGSGAARWIAADALRELSSDKLQARLGQKEAKASR